MSDRFGRPIPRSHESLRKLSKKELANMLEKLKKKEKKLLEELKEEEDEIEKEEDDLAAAKKEINQSKKTINQSKKKMSILEKKSNIVKVDIEIAKDAKKYDETTGKEVRKTKYHYSGGKRKTKKARKSKKNYWFF